MPKIIRADFRRSLQLLREANHRFLGQDTLDQIGDGYIVAGVGEIDAHKSRFLLSLPNTKRGLAIRSSKLKTYDCRKGLKDEYNYAREVKGLPQTRKATRDKFLDEVVNQEWFRRLPQGMTSESRLSFKQDYLSQERTLEITGLNFYQLAVKSAASCDLLWLASVEDLQECDTAVHYNGNKTRSQIFINRNIPRNRSEKSSDWRYFPAEDEDGFVPKWEIEGYDSEPEGRKYQGDNFQRPTEKTF